MPSDAAADDDEVVVVLAAARGGGGGRGEGEGVAGGAVFFVVVVIFYSVSVASVCVSSRSLLLFSERGNVDAAGSPARARGSPPPPRRSQGAKKKNEEEVEKQRLEARRVSGRSIAQRVFLFRVPAFLVSMLARLAPIARFEARSDRDLIQLGQGSCTQSEQTHRGWRAARKGKGTERKKKGKTKRGSSLLFLSLFLSSSVASPSPSRWRFHASAPRKRANSDEARMPPRSQEPSGGAQAALAFFPLPLCSHLPGRRAATRLVDAEAEAADEEACAATPAAPRCCLAATAGRANAEQRVATPPEDRRGAEARIFLG